MDTSVVTAARSGDRRAMDALLAEYLPLVYSIVRRTLSSTADVDDVVQDTMVRVVRGIGGLREPDRFRSWLVAVTVNQIRDFHGTWHSVPRQELGDEHPDPNAEFVDLALTGLDLSRQRQEIVRAARWLQAEDQELLSLWSLERGGHMSRVDITTALRQNAHHVAVRVGRLKQRLEAARLLERAVTTVPRCPGLAEAASKWPGKPSSVWRKRLLRHVSGCRACRAAEDGMMPAERVFLGLALLPLPVGYLPGLLADVHLTAELGRAAGEVDALETKQLALHHRIVDFVATKPLLTAAGVSAVCALGLTTVVVSHLSAAGPTTALVGTSTTTSAAPQSSRSPSTAPLSTAPSAIAPTSGTTAPAPRTTSPTQPRMTTPAPVVPPNTPTSTTPATLTPAERVLAVMNQARAGARLKPYEMDAKLVNAAAGHNQVMAGGCGLNHECSGEPGAGVRISAAGAQWGELGENIGSGGPVDDTTSAIGDKAVGLTNAMLGEKPPDDGHRRNILSSSYTKVGIAVTRDASGVVWMTQEFTG
ncbi:hypothetical protein GCM10027200_52480 [Lentzea nigeriaca]